MRGERGGGAIVVYAFSLCVSRLLIPIHGLLQLVRSYLVVFHTLSFKSQDKKEKWSGRAKGRTFHFEPGTYFG